VSTRRTLALAALLVAVGALGLGGCPGGDSNGSATGGSAGASATGGAAGGGAGGNAGDPNIPPWDPVWHLTEPKPWPSIGTEGLPDCGPGCRIALNVYTTNPSYYGHTYTTEMVGSKTPEGLVLAKLGLSESLVLGPKAVSGGPRAHQPHLSGDFISYLYLENDRNDIMVMSWRTGEKKLAYTYERQNSADSVSLTALNSSYVFWHKYTVGMMSRNLQTGEVKVLAGGAWDCISLCATEQGLICAGGRNIFIDHDTGEQEVLNYDGALQLLGFCSPDKKQYVWIDYRDPPGRDSTYDFYRNGGEVYMMDLQTRAVRRLTFDSPDNPRAKDLPAIGGNLAVWSEPPNGADPNPDSYQTVRSGSTALATLDLTTGERCQLSPDPTYVMGYKSVHGRHVYGSWFHIPTAKTYLVDIDLDDPALQWQCQMTPFAP